MNTDTMIGLIVLALAIPMFTLAAFLIRVVIFGVLVKFTLRCIGIKL